MVPIFQQAAGFGFLRLTLVKQLCCENVRSFFLHLLSRRACPPLQIQAYQSQFFL